MTRLRQLLPVLVATLTLCAACSGSATSESSGADEAAARHGAAASAAGGATTADRPRTAATTPLERQLIRTAELTVAVRGASQLGAQADAAGAIAERTGGEIDSDDRSAGARPAATLQLRVPPMQLDQVLHRLAALGVEQSRSSSTQDVTERVADVTSRVHSAQDSLTRLRALYGRATRVADVIAIESEINNREADLESLQAQQRALDRQTALASVTVHLVVAARHHQPTPPRAGGFVGGVQRGWHAFVTAAVALSAAFGALLPFLALAFVLGLLARLLGLRLPRVARRRTTPSAD
ncbi:DUF4349 domain-containing protein [uncultured Jatrophihabitans sp.]|uniref:DUF4349 domain-containing protein n=1 Tax=uncultured Jatrophihabitans sp. TaxID=1610747 RepID=UPI0035CCA775